MSEQFDEAKDLSLAKWRGHLKDLEEEVFRSIDTFFTIVLRDCGFCMAYFEKGTLNSCDACPVHYNPCRSEEWDEKAELVAGDDWKEEAKKFCRWVIDLVEKTEEMR